MINLLEEKLNRLVAPDPRCEMCAAPAVPMTREGVMGKGTAPEPAWRCYAHPTLNWLSRHMKEVKHETNCPKCSRAPEAQRPSPVHTEVEYHRDAAVEEEDQYRIGVA